MQNERTGVETRTVNGTEKKRSMRKMKRRKRREKKSSCSS